MFNVVSPCNVFLLWLEGYQGAQHIADEFDCLDTEVLHDEMVEESGHQLHLQHLLCISNSIAVIQVNILCLLRMQKYKKIVLPLTYSCLCTNKYYMHIIMGVKIL